ncbi:HAMP domain-containing sensor histidine kinase [Peptoniphilus lacrimalis]|uniref:sensor histidine kinase n=1 Tax=Peptoniphilus lacrimalis TaxID=33031 RepID=UPI002551B0BD|nr:HAMP domain-containing sensor histidine kinase [Peptoniphilus lacrimalis]MDK7721453.1 HAMP domain-containing sensor histidine kinase [Peptoniphilus lacrimalis]MDK7731054.1 HAMP domain-containing sensor histidine kinase [Peptoniphilus lacrimalis]
MKNLYNKLSKYLIIVFIIALFSTSTSYGICRFYKSYRNEENIRAAIVNKVSKTILDSIYRSDNYNYDYGSDDFDFYVKSYKTKYYDSFGNSIDDNEVKFRLDLKDKKEKLTSQGLDPKEFMSEEDLKKTDIIEKNQVFYINSENNKEIDPYTLKYNADTVFAIRGAKDANGIKTEILRVNYDDVFAINIEDIFPESIRNEYHQLLGNENIKNIKFFYNVDRNSPAYNNIYKEIRVIDKYDLILTSMMINCILMLIFVIFQKYKDIMENEKLKKIFSISLEIFIILFLIFFVGGVSITDMFYKEDFYSFNVFFFLFLVCVVLGNFILSLSVNYVLLIIKSFYYDGSKNLLVKNSMLAKLFRKSFVEIGNAQDERALNNAKRSFTIAYLIIIFLGLGYILSFMRFYRGLTLTLYFIVFTIIYIIAIKTVNEIGRISIESSKISAGDFDYKVSKNYQIFDRIIDNFNNIGNNLDKAVEEATKSQRMKTELITNVSHDLKTPLTSIINYSDLLNKDSSNSQKAKEYSKIIYDKSLRLKTLIEDLFEVSKASSENIQLNLEKIDFKALILQAMGEWEDKFKEKNIEFVSTLPENPLILDLDGQKISRVLDNIFSNIYKYGAEHSRVYIDLISDNKVKLFVKNISKYPLNISAEELMERFTRGDKSRNTEGSGLGLSIADSLINAHKGEFHIEIDGDLFKTIIIL